ncbi:hypothetical protein HZR84_14000 [Hyphobacterium sp. CCMP332]|nr:hypothetical protein HZR84_14000 [Hyphobacterium sp. CCMP332]
MKNLLSLTLLLTSLSSQAQIQEEVINYSGTADGYKVSVTGILEYEFSRDKPGSGYFFIMKARWKQIQMTSIVVDGKTYTTGTYGDTKIPYESTGFAPLIRFKVSNWGNESYDKSEHSKGSMVGLNPHTGWNQIWFDFGIDPKNYTKEEINQKYEDWVRYSVLTGSEITSLEGGTASVLAGRLKEYAHSKEKSFSEQISDKTQEQERERELLERGQVQSQPNYRDEYNQKISEGFNELTTLVNKFSSISAERKAYAKQFANNLQMQLDAGAQRIEERNMLINAYKQTHSKEYLDIKSALINNRFANGELKVSRAIELAYNNQVSNVFVLPIQIKANTPDNVVWADQNSNLQVEPEDFVGRDIDIYTDLQPKSITVSKYSFDNRSRIEDLFTKNDCQNCYGKGYNLNHAVLVAYDYESLYSELQQILNNQNYLFVNVKKEGRFVYDLSSDSSIKLELDKMNTKKNLLATDKLKVNKMLTGHAYIVGSDKSLRNTQRLIIINKGRFIMMATNSKDAMSLNYSDYFRSRFVNLNGLKIKKQKGVFANYGFHEMVFNNEFLFSTNLYISDNEYAYEAKTNSNNFAKTIFLGNAKRNGTTYNEFKSYIIVGSVNPYMDSYRLVYENILPVQGGLLLVGDYKETVFTNIPGYSQSKRISVYNMRTNYLGWFATTEADNILKYRIKQFNYWLNPTKIPIELSFEKHSSLVEVYDFNSGQYRKFDPANSDSDFNTLYASFLVKSSLYFGNYFIFRLSKE